MNVQQDAETHTGAPRTSWMFSSLLCVVVAWVWNPVGAALTAMSMVLLLMAVWHVGFSEAVSAGMERPYLFSYVEVVAAGLLPLALTVACKEDFTRYGLTTTGLGRSTLLSLIIAIIPITLGFLTTGRWLADVSSFHLDFPWNLWYATLGVFAYGPLEVFYVVWLIANTDALLRTREKKVSSGLIVTAALFGLLHLITSPTAGIPNALRVGVEFFALDLVYKWTGNSVRPMLAWTIISGQVLFLAVGALT